MNPPSWLWFAVAILCVLAILYLLGVRFDLDSSDAMINLDSYLRGDL